MRRMVSSEMGYHVDEMDVSDSMPDIEVDVREGRERDQKGHK